MLYEFRSRKFPHAAPAARIEASSLWDAAYQLAEWVYHNETTNVWMNPQGVGSVLIRHHADANGKAFDRVYYGREVKG